MKTYNDPVKQLAREKLRDFIARHLLPFRSAKSLRVACFPGAEVEGEEALEVKEVYDPLGIPRENITGLEEKTKIAERLRNAQLGIQVERKNANDYFLTAPYMSFDIISLDYTGQQTLQDCLAIEYIASRQLLKKDGILATNYFASRERGEMKQLLALRLMNSVARTSNISVNTVMQQGRIFEKTEKLEDLKDSIADVPLQLLREGITQETITLLASGTLNRPIGKHLFSTNPLRSHALKNIRENIEKNVGRIPDELRSKEETDQCTLEQIYQESMREKLLENLSHQVGNISASALVSILTCNAQQPYLTKVVERYGYTSNSGSPMMMDLFACRPCPSKFFTEASKLISYRAKQVSQEVMMNLNPKHMPLEKFTNRLERLTFEYMQQTSYTMLARQELTSEIPRIQSQSMAPSEPSPSSLYEPTDAEKREIYDHLRAKNLSEQEICAQYKVIPRQLGSYKAWITMEDKKKQEKLA